MLASHDISIDFNAKYLYNKNTQTTESQRKLKVYDPGFLADLRELGIEIPNHCKYEDDEINEEDQGW